MPSPLRAMHAHADLQVLALNSGSSSLKFGQYQVHAGGVEPLLSGTLHAFGKGQATLRASDAKGRVVRQEQIALNNPADGLPQVAALLAEQRLPAAQALAHRVVHGGPQLRAHCVINPAVLARLSAAASFAPLHTPQALAMIDRAGKIFPGLPQVACFDTCFHARMPELARTLPLPQALRREGLERYGFHGLSCESIVAQLAGQLPQRLLIAHLGSGASVTAVLNGVSCDTSMGLTPCGGLIMGTRSGNLDPGVLIYLMREHQLSADDLEELIDQRSGLLGISGLSGDMQTLHRAQGTHAQAQLAIDMFCAAAAKELAAMATVLGDVDLIVFTGGIGENDAAIRAAIGKRLWCLGVVLDDGRGEDAVPSALLSHPSSRCAVRVLPAQEEVQMAHHAWRLQAHFMIGGQDAPLDHAP